MSGALRLYYRTFVGRRYRYQFPGITSNCRPIVPKHIHDEYSMHWGEKLDRNVDKRSRLITGFSRRILEIMTTGFTGTHVLTP